MKLVIHTEWGATLQVAHLFFTGERGVVTRSIDLLIDFGPFVYEIALRLKDGSMFPSVRDWIRQTKMGNAVMHPAPDGTPVFQGRNALMVCKRPYAIQPLNPFQSRGEQGIVLDGKNDLYRWSPADPSGDYLPRHNSPHARLPDGSIIALQPEQRPADDSVCGFHLQWTTLQDESGPFLSTKPLRSATIPGSVLKAGSPHLSMNM